MKDIYYILKTNSESRTGVESADRADALEDLQDLETPKHLLKKTMADHLACSTNTILDKAV